MLEGSVSVVSPGAYVVSDGTGDLGVGEEQGFFYRDMRHLSGFVLRINGERLSPRGFRVWGSRAEFSLGLGGIRVVRRRELGVGMDEEIVLSNRSPEATEVRVELECAADFLDVFEVRGYHRARERGEIAEKAQDGGLRFSYRRGRFARGTLVRVSGEGMEPVAEPGGLSVGVRLEAGESRTVRVAVTLEKGDRELRSGRPGLLYGRAPALETGSEALRRSWERSVEDLESLAFDAGGGLLVPAAGAPWYMALFGRDALITGYTTMTLGPEPARNALRALARHQASQRDDFRDAEPGKILHEMRFGELAFSGEVPHSPYYGTVDATPLFLILLNEVWRWTADDEFVRHTEGAARRALTWIFDHSDTDGDGYADYAPRSTAGLRNHCWKDSTDSMLFRDGTRAEGPVAPCEVQGYVHDAFLRTAELAERVWQDPPLAADLRSEAGDLRDRFDRDFWMEDRGYYALALDGDGQKVDSLTSNAGHLLWSGIVPGQRARAIVERLMGEELFGGWGVRTMAVGEGGYDPESYHNGSVWPHDNALVSYGLRRYGFRKEANRVASGLLDAAPFFDYRLPEVFAGYPRKESPAPVELPKSCSPQAWAAATIPMLVRTMLGVEPDLRSRTLTADPVLPDSVPGLRLGGVSAFGERHAIRA